jgi:hypothetical protein
MIEVDELLDIARENITTTQMKQEYDTLMKALYECANELNSIKDLEKTWIDTRNMIINKLYHEHKVSMIKIGDICGISRQMVHYICKGRKA